MKFIKEITSRGLLIPMVAAQLAKFKAGESEDSPLPHLPTDLLLTFAEAGTCLGELEEHLITEDIVYGK